MTSTTLLFLFAMAVSFSANGKGKDPKPPSFDYSCKSSKVAEYMFTPTTDSIKIYAKPDAKSAVLRNRRAYQTVGDLRVAFATRDSLFQSYCEKGEWVLGKIMRKENLPVGGVNGWFKKSEVKRQSDRLPMLNPSADVLECMKRGDEYFKSLDAWPYLDTGRSASETAATRCQNTKSAFDSWTGGDMLH
ncbi:MAG: hypothetical protein EOP05_01340 [Proteobacteria bacterium]|nr:MAG: hypothetical protein EOP05_01340 [Pseudomonadota bacterium]